MYVRCNRLWKGVLGGVLTYRHGRESLTLERKRNAVNNVPGSDDVIIDHPSVQPLQTGASLHNLQRFKKVVDFTSQCNTLNFE